MRTCFAMTRLWLILAVAFLAAFGCGRSGPIGVEVAGSVAYRGKPVDGANVLFISAKNRPASAKTDSQGRFTMKTFVANNGENLEEQVVCVTKTVPDPKANSGDLYAQYLSVLPVRYGTPVQSPLKAAVTVGGPNIFDFELADSP